MANFNALEELLGQSYFRIKFKEKYPHCSDCKYVNELIFSKRYYENSLKKRACVNCDKFKIEE